MMKHAGCCSRPAENSIGRSTVVTKLTVCFTEFVAIHANSQNKEKEERENWGEAKKSRELVCSGSGLNVARVDHHITIHEINRARVARPAPRHVFNRHRFHSPSNEQQTRPQSAST
jgi:hypothetical protein